jgi:hypothetical protein
MPMFGGSKTGRGLRYTCGAHALVVALICTSVAGIKLRITSTECVRQAIDTTDSLVTVSVVAGMLRSEQVFVDMMVRAPTGCACSV